MPPGTVIRSFATPSIVPSGLTWDGRALWLCDWNTDQIYQIDPVTGTAIRNFASPAAEPVGLTWDGSHLWNTDRNTDRIYQIDPTTGTAIRSFASPAASPRGITWDGRNLWIADEGTRRIYQVDPITGTVIRDFASPSTFPTGLTWDGAWLWHSDITTDRIYQIDPVTGTAMRSFPAPNISTRGLAWDGRALWCADITDAFIYQLSVTPGASYADRVIATGPIGYWDQGEAAGTISFDISGHSPLSERDGAYTAVTLGQPGIGDGRTSALYDGATSFDDILTASLIAAFNGAAGTLGGWFRVSAAGVWTDGTQRYGVYLFADANNELRIGQRTAVNNTIRSRYEAATTIEVNDHTLSPTAWYHTAMTWSAAADEVRYYLNGVPDGAIDVGLGIWAGNFAIALIGASSVVPANVWSGYIAHTALWDRPLSPAEVLSLGAL